LEQPFDKEVAQAVALLRIEQEGEEVGVAEFLAHCAQRFKDIELRQHRFETVKVRVVDDQGFEEL
jgi:hypothetical protein